MKKTELKQIIREEIKNLVEQTVTKLDHPIPIKLVALPDKSRGWKHEGDSVAAMVRNQKDFDKALKRFYKKINSMEDDLIIGIRPVKDRIGALTPDEESFIEYLAWDTGKHYELYY